jgi:predicted esterase YcpF (UPF0227 family)
MKKNKSETILEDITSSKPVILYLHGFGSSGQSGTVKHLRKKLSNYNVLAPDIPVNPSVALPFLKKFCEENRPHLIICIGPISIMLLK